MKNRFIQFILAWLFVAMPAHTQTIKVCKAPPAGGGTFYLNNGFESGTVDVPPWGTDNDPNTNVTAGCAQSGNYGLDILYSICGPPLNAPTLAQVASGSQGARTYYVKITYASTGVADGQTTVSPQANLAISANNVLRVTSPPAHPNVDGYFVYASTTSGAEKKQNTTKVNIGTNWTEPDSGLVNNGDPPSTTTGCRSQHQDDTHAVVFSDTNGFSHFFQRAYFKIKPVESGAYTELGRKLFYDHDVLSGPDNWSTILSVVDLPSDGWPGAGPLKLTWGIQNAPLGGGSWTLDCGSTSPITGIGCAMQYDTWYSIELEIKNNTNPSSPWNGEARIWVNGEMVFAGTGGDFNRASSYTLKRFDFGEMADRPTWEVVNEHRCLDSVKMSDSYIGP